MPSYAYVVQLIAVIKTKLSLIQLLWRENTFCEIVKFLKLLS